MKKVNHSWENFRIKEAADTLYHFLWEDFCDWYLESAKASREESQSTLLHVLGQYLKLLHPICPHVTEELWHQLPGVPEEELISLEQFPEFREGQMGEVIEFEYLRSLISSIRNVRAENSIKPSLNIEIFADDLSDDEKVLIEKEEKLIQLLAKVEKISWNSTAAAPSTQIVFPSLVEGKTSAFSLSLGELVDVAEETQRLEKEIKQIQGYIVGLERKLANRSFVENAPEAVVNKERDKLSQARDKCAKLEIGLVQLQEKA